MVVFMLFLVFADLLDLVSFTSASANASWYRTSPRQWVYPLQTIACLAVLTVCRKHYRFTSHRNGSLAAALGVVGIVIWVAPGFLYQQWQMTDGWWKYLGFADRRDGFNPLVMREFGENTFRAAVVFRFVRLVVAVPLVEEIFWRGFLMRFCVNPDGDYKNVPFGTHHRRSLFVVTAAFVLVHDPIDYLAATVFGLLMYFTAVRTKSLSACVLMHATANLLLGFYIMWTHQWGYW
jgi:CAAX prenyl protease-like protein